VPTVAEIFRRHGGEYLRRFGKSMPLAHKSALRLIAHCRTARLGYVRYQCTKCGKRHVMGRSCGNRHCPACQHDKTRTWLEKQASRLLPTHYFLLTFTVPAELRPFVRAHQEVCYRAMFQASAETIRELASNPKFIGSDRCGFTGVLHTWGRRMNYHPHLHYLVPGGALSPDGSRWLPSRPDFLIPVRAASILFRAKFKNLLHRQGLLEKIDPQVNARVWSRNWIVHSKPVGDGRASLKYLATYVFRVAISDRRIVSLGKRPDGTPVVTYLWKKGGTRRWRRTTVTAIEFIRRFLQHVLPSGFQKVRHFGWLSPQAKNSIDRVRWLIALWRGEVFLLLARSDQKQTPPKPRIRCAHCGGEVIVTGFHPPVRGPPLGLAEN
jgi:Putative transposase/Transposase zinc-binding domain